MIRLTKRILVFAILCLVFTQKGQAQSIINPSDPVLEYDPGHPPTNPNNYQLVKWVRTQYIEDSAVQKRNPGWKSDVYKAYNYNGIAFRVQFPKTYTTVKDGKKYPLIIFLHGQGENDITYLGPTPPRGAGSPNYDNQWQLLQGPPQFDKAMQQGKYDGFVIAPQLQNNVSSLPTYYYKGILTDILTIVKYMINNNKVDPYHIIVNGLSEGGVGCWDFLDFYPTYIAASTPMSSPAVFSIDSAHILTRRFTPVWISQGGVDKHPTPAETQRIADSMLKYGANFRESYYPSAGHGTWYAFWNEPDFWPFVNNAYSSNPWMLGGLKHFWPGQPVNGTIGVAPGFAQYQWRLNGNVISGAAGNALHITAPGLYEAKVLRDSVWSDWSHVPVNIRPGFYEAEDYINMNGINTESTSDIGGGKDVGWIGNGDWLDYSINPYTAGLLTLQLRVASVSGGQIQIRNSSGAVLATANVPATGGYQVWQTISTSISLPSGAQTIRLYATTGGWNLNWMQFSQESGTPPPPSSTRIEAENWSAMSGVQTENTSDVGGGKDVGWINNGDWMDYGVSVSSAGSYTINLRLATPYSGVQLQVKNSSGTVLGTLNVPTTGGFQLWQTVPLTVNLASGTQTIRIQSTANSGFNINWLEIASVTTGTPPPPSSTRIEAENWSAMSGVQTENTSDVGGGKDVGWINNGDWMDYGVSVSSAGSYTINLRLATPYSGVQLQVKNSSGTVLGTLNVPTTGGFQLWQTVPLTVNLASGTQTIRIQSTANSGFNINWLEITQGGPAAITSRSVSEVREFFSSTKSELSIYPNPVVNNFQLQINNDLTGNLNVRVYDMSGRIQQQFSLTKTDTGTSQFNLFVGELRAANYIIKASMNNWSASQQILKQ